MAWVPAHYTFNVFAVPTFLTAVAVLVLAIAVVIRERNSLVSLVFCLLALSISVWLLSFSWMYAAVDASTALWWAKTAYVGVVCIPAAIYHFTIAVLRLYGPRKRQVWASWALSAAFAAASVGTDALIPGLHHYWWGFYPRYGWLGAPYLIFFFGLMIVSLHEYWHADQQATPGTVPWRRARSLLVAFSILYLGSVDYLAKYGVPLYPFGYVPVLAFVMLAARAIWRYRLVDLTPAFAAKQILRTLCDPLVVLDQDGVIRVANPAACQLFQRSAGRVIGSRLSELSSTLLPSDRLEALMRTGGPQQYETTCKGPSGPVTLEVSVSVIWDRRVIPVGIICIGKDITTHKRADEALEALNETLEQRVAERSAAAEERARELANANAELDVVMKDLQDANARLEQLSLLDPLTELFNRRGLQQVLSRELRLTGREGSSLLALLIDLDDFKRVNNSLGYPVGDAVLKEMAKKLASAVRATDHVARIGGDEFMVLLSRTRPVEGLRIAEKIRLAISGAPLPISPEDTVTITASLGLVEVSSKSPALDEVVSQAHLALFRSKQAGKNQVFYARQEAWTSGGRRSTLLDILATMRRGDSFRVVMQPIVRLGDLAPMGYELLSRLDVKEFETPDLFFPVALEANILTLVDHHCFRTCIVSVPSPSARGRCHVNLFPSTLINIPIQDLLEAFRGNRAHGTYCIELSERQIVGEPSYLVEPIAALKRAGILIGIDDVGFGRSSLESLIMLEPDLIKIDKRCVQGIAVDLSRARSLQRLLRLAQALETDVVAEGIESEDDFNALKNLGVTYGQGYFLGYPVDVRTMPQELAHSARLEKRPAVVQKRKRLSSAPTSHVQHWDPSPSA